jgi:hypothetical protein
MRQNLSHNFTKAIAMKKKTNQNIIFLFLIFFFLLAPLRRSFAISDISSREIEAIALLREMTKDFYANPSKETLDAVHSFTEKRFADHSDSAIVAMYYFWFHYIKTDIVGSLKILIPFLLEEPVHDCVYYSIWRIMNTANINCTINHGSSSNLKELFGDCENHTQRTLKLAQYFADQIKSFDFIKIKESDLKDVIAARNKLSQEETIAISKDWLKYLANILDYRNSKNDSEAYNKIVKKRALDYTMQQKKKQQNEWEKILSILREYEQLKQFDSLDLIAKEISKLYPFRRALSEYDDIPNLVKLKQTMSSEDEAEIFNLYYIYALKRNYKYVYDNIEKLPKYWFDERLLFLNLMCLEKMQAKEEDVLPILTKLIEMNPEETRYIFFMKRIKNME